MNTKHHTTLPEGLQTAVGLVWSLLDQYQPQQALVLLEGCLSCWPHEPILALLHQTCLADTGQPLQINVLEQLPAQWAPMLKTLQTRQQLNQAVHP